MAENIMDIDRLELNSTKVPLSVLTHLDSRCRLGAGVFLIAVAVNLGHVTSLLMVIGLCAACLVTNSRVMLLRLVPVNIFTAMLWVTLPLGAWAGSLRGLTPHYGTVFGDALVYTLRINSAVLLYMVFIIPLGIGGLRNTLEKLHAPSKLVALLVLTYRFIFVMYGRVCTAARVLRLREPLDAGVRLRLRGVACVVSSALIGAEMRSVKVWIALQNRGFTGAFPLTQTFQWRVRDTITLVCAAGFGVGLLVYEYLTR